MTNQTTQKIKPSFDLLNLLAEKVPGFDYHYIDGIENLDCSFISLSRFFPWFSDDYITNNILNALHYSNFNLIDFENAVDSITFDIGVYSRFYDTQFNNQEEYNDCVREHCDDFIRFAKYEQTRFILIADSDEYSSLSLNLNNVIDEQSEHIENIEELLNKYLKVIEQLKEDFKTLLKSINDINQCYNDINDGYFIPDLSSNALNVLYFYLDSEDYDNFINGYNYQTMNRLIEKDTLKKKLESKPLKEKTKTIKI